MSQADDICDFAQTQLGVPFVLGKRLANQALDCVGLILVTARALGIPLQEPSPYSRRDLVFAKPHVLALACGLLEKDMEAVSRGDVVRLAINQRFPIHFGIILGDHVIHACDVAKKVVVKPFVNCLDRRMEGCYSWPR